MLFLLLGKEEPTTGGEVPDISEPTGSAHLRRFDLAGHHQHAHSSAVQPPRCNLIRTEEDPFMRKFLSALTAAVLAASFALPARAAPSFVPRPEQVKTGAVEQVDHRRNWRDSHWNRRHAWRSCRYYGRCFPRYDYTQSYGYRDDYRYNRRPSVNIYLNF
jgi:hypothetical protein